MDNSLVRQRYTRRPATARRRRRAPGTNGSSLRLIISRQLAICVLLLIIIGIVKSINLSATNYITDKIKYVLSYNIELKSVFTYIDKLASDIKKGIVPAAIGGSASKDDPATAGNQTSSNAPASSTAQTSSNTQTSSSTPTSTAAPSIADKDETGMIPVTGNNTATLSSEVPESGTVEASSSIGNESHEGSSYAEVETTSPESSVLSAKSENVSLSGMLVPVEGTLSSLFGDKSAAITGNGKIHKGIDINVKKSGNIKAALDGRVSETGSSPDYGSYIRIKHADGLQTIYANCSSLIVQKGDIVKRGDVIAGIGDKGNSAGIHLHFEVWKDGNAVDPLEYISVPAR